ncbi:MAG: hypothetical protein AAF533_07980 [Acidobacteriota bacterium]
MRERQLQLLSGFVDGESIAPTDLAEVLSAEGALDALRDFALISAQLDDDGLEPSETFEARVRRRLSGDDDTERRTGSRTWPWLMAAAAVVLGVVLGRSLNPTPSLPASLPTAEVGGPKVDRTLVFEPGVDWKELS